jgi:hypothetical protein
MRVSFAVFLSSEGLAPMGIRDFGEWKHYAIERFKGILPLAVKNAEKPIPRYPIGQRNESRPPGTWSKSVTVLFGS